MLWGGAGDAGRLRLAQVWPGREPGVGVGTVGVGCAGKKQWFSSAVSASSALSSLSALPSPHP